MTASSQHKMHENDSNGNFRQREDHTQNITIFGEYLTTSLVYLGISLQRISCFTRSSICPSFCNCSLHFVVTFLVHILQICNKKKKCKHLDIITAIENTFCLCKCLHVRVQHEQKAAHLHQIHNSSHRISFFIQIWLQLENSWRNRYKLDCVILRKYGTKYQIFPLYVITLSSLYCKSNQFPFEALKSMMTTLVGLTSTLLFSGTISWFNLGLVNR